MLRCSSYLTLASLQIIPLLISASIARAEDSPAWQDLLKELEPEKAAVTGTWTLEDGQLSVDAATGARLMLPYQPRGEYDFEVSFTRQRGVHSICLIFAAGGKQATLDIDAWGEHLAGIQNIDGKTVRDNPTRTADVLLTNGQKYTATVKVRKDSIGAWLDDRRLATHRSDGSDLGLLDLWRLPQTGALGIGAWDSATTFHSVRVRAISGESSTPTVTASKGSDTPPRSRPSPSSPDSPPSSSSQQEDLTALSDEFDDAGTLKNWRRVYQQEQTGADQLQTWDIGRTRDGWMTLVPHTSTWYQDYRGVMVYKQVQGDFVVTTQVHATSRNGQGAPRSAYSLAGIMVRTPRDVTPQTWRPGGENYIFLSLGAARQSGRFAFEVKTTIDSRSNLEVTEAGGPQALIQVARIGSDFILLRKEPQRRWQVHRRYRRTDMPQQLQVGFTVYTDYATASRLQPRQQNTQVIRGGNPDLRASFDFIRYQRPQTPEALQGKSLTDPQVASDAELLKFLGEPAGGEQGRD